MRLGRLRLHGLTGLAVTSVTCSILSAALSGCVATRPRELQVLVEVQINNTAATIDDYIAWAPTRSRARIVSPWSWTGSIDVTLRNMDPNTGGQILFAYAADITLPNTTATRPTLDL